MRLSISESRKEDRFLLSLSDIVSSIYLMCIIAHIIRICKYSDMGLFPHRGGYTDLMKQRMQVALAILTAAAIIIAAWLTKGTEHENAWLWVIAVYGLISGSIELYVGRKSSSK